LGPLILVLALPHHNSIRRGGRAGAAVPGGL